MGTFTWATLLAWSYPTRWHGARHAGLGKAHTHVRNQMQKAKTLKRRGSAVGCARFVSRSLGLLLVASLAGGRWTRQPNRVIIARAERANAALRAANNVSFLLHTAVRLERQRGVIGVIFSKI